MNRRTFFTTVFAAVIATPALADSRRRRRRRRLQRRRRSAGTFTLPVALAVGTVIVLDDGTRCEVISTDGSTSWCQVVD